MKLLLRGVFALVICSLFLSGCVAPGYSPEKEMLFEDKIHIEPRIGVFVPNESDFSGGTVVATRLAYQYDYGQYFSLEFGATENVEQDGTAPTVTSVGQIRDLKQTALSESDRRSLVLSFDWDYRIDQDETVPYLRWGLGLGMLYTLNGTNPTVRADLLGLGIPKVYVKDQAMILVRPSVGVFWEPMENLALFADAQYDYAQSKVRVSLAGDDSKTGIVDFGGINLLFGFSYSF